VPEPLPEWKVKKIWELKDQGKSNREIANILGISKYTVIKYVKRRGAMENKVEKKLSGNHSQLFEFLDEMLEDPEVDARELYLDLREWLGFTRKERELLRNFFETINKIRDILEPNEPMEIDIIATIRSAHSETIPGLPYELKPFWEKGKQHINHLKVELKKL